MTTTLYWTDNGAILCRDHLGASARMTGRDISGQPIAQVTDADRIAWSRETGTTMQCETCRWRRDTRTIERAR